MEENRFQSEVMRLLNVLIEKVDGHDKRLAQIDNWFDKLEVRFDSLEGRFGNIESRFDTLERKVDILSAQVTEIVLKVIALNERLLWL